jgi:hypothetical protein
MIAATNEVWSQGIPKNANDDTHDTGNRMFYTQACQ